MSMEVAQFVFENVARREGPAWMGARQNPPRSDEPGQVVSTLRSWSVPVDDRAQRRLQGVHSIPGLLDAYMLKGVRQDSQLGLWGLCSARYSLQVRYDIPSPRQMLDAQCAGRRFVTYLRGEEDETRQIGRFRGAYEFLMHDLEHAHKFFGGDFRGQVGFFVRLREALPLFEGWLADPLFAKDFDYLISDMNSHPVHLFKYLKAIVLTADLRAGRPPAEAEFWSEALSGWGASDAQLEAGLRINKPGVETDADKIMISDFFREGCRLTGPTSRG